MGTLVIIISGLFGAVTGSRKDFSQNWIFLVNLSFSLYIAILLTPLMTSLLDIPNLATGYKNAIALGGIFLVMDFILKKTVDQIWPDSEMNKFLPEFLAKIGSLIAGFFSGALLAAIIIHCFIQTPFSSSLSFRGNLQSASGKTMLILVNTLNGLSGQWDDTAKMSQLKSLGVVSVERPAETKEDVQKTENTAAEKTVEKSDGDAEKKADPSEETQKGKERSASDLEKDLAL